MVPDGLGTRLVAGVGKAFVQPNYTDLYGYDSPANFGLKAEESIGGDIGIEQPITKNSAVSVTYFHNWITDLITYNESNFQAINASGTTETHRVLKQPHTHRVTIMRFPKTGLDPWTSRSADSRGTWRPRQWKLNRSTA